MQETFVRTILIGCQRLDSTGNTSPGPILDISDFRVQVLEVDIAINLIYNFT